MEACDFFTNRYDVKNDENHAAIIDNRIELICSPQDVSPCLPMTFCRTFRA